MLFRSVWKMKGWKYELRGMEEGDRLRLVDGQGLSDAALPTAFRAYRQAAEEILAAREGENK